MKKSVMIGLIGLAGLSVVMTASCRKSPEPPPWAPLMDRILTRWGRDLNPSEVHPEYPRPQMVRSEWLNLNGMWEYAIRPEKEDCPQAFDGWILVPFPVESALSGVGKPVGKDNRLWYRREFVVPGDWSDRDVHLNFEAVDWETRIWINGREIGDHRGGYDPFTLDITPALKKRGRQEIVLSVWDPTDDGTQPRGKQVKEPRGIWYTAVTGIWRTVWLEPVHKEAVRSLRVIPDLDSGNVEVMFDAPGKSESTILVAEVSAEGIPVSRAVGAGGDPIRLKVPDPRPWSPGEPFLYTLAVRMESADGRVLDEIRSYFGMRKISLCRDGEGRLRLCLNGQILFQFGPLDQGWWPDGLYTAPTDEALRFDLEVTQKLGFNMLRKHVKVESRRFYYWCDTLGLLVWQDMPSGDRYVRRGEPDIQRSNESAAQFKRELRRVMDSLVNHPSIVMWVPFNEGWGQFETEALTAWIKSYDPTRLVNSASGWADRGTGDVLDIHSYPGPEAPAHESERASVLGEFGGLGLPLTGHTWQDEKNWGYRNLSTGEELEMSYADLIEKLLPMIKGGLAAAVYTQTTDVEIEVNGLMTYDREVVKMEAGKIAAVNRRVYEQVR